MRHAATVTVFAAALAVAADVHGQVVLVPVPYDSYAFPGKGYGVRYKKGGNLTLSAYYSSGYGYGGLGTAGWALPTLPALPGYYGVPPPVTGVVTGRLSMNYYAPAPAARPAWRSEVEGIDLDLVPPKKPPRDEAPPPQVRPKLVEPERQLPGVDVSKPKPPMRPRDDEAKIDVPPPRQDPPPQPPPAKDNPREANAQLIDLGLAAFAAQEYGSAAQRFRQATLIEPNVALAHFLLGQAQLALGKYDEAVAAIHDGLKLHKNWPNVPFHPRVEMYKGNEADFVMHLKRLEDVLAKKANADLLFLYAYQLWYDGRRKDAVPFFRQARPLARDPVYIDRFLAAVPPEPIALKP